MLRWTCDELGSGNAEWSLFIPYQAAVLNILEFEARSPMKVVNL